MRKILSVSLFICLCLLPHILYAQNAIKQERPGARVQTSNKGAMGQWVSNGEVKVLVTKVEEVTTWSQLPLSKRYTPSVDKEFKFSRKSVESGEAKFVLVTVEAKNISNRQRKIGYDTLGSVGGFHIRGDEGSEQFSGNSNWFSKDIKTGTLSSCSKLPFYITGNFPKSAEISPGGMAKGKLLFAVPAWFTPALLFTKPYTTGLCMGKNELIITLK